MTLFPLSLNSDFGLTLPLLLSHNHLSIAERWENSCEKIGQELCSSQLNVITHPKEGEHGRGGRHLESLCSVPEDCR